MRTLAFAALLVFASALHAQTAEDYARQVITQAGNACPRVTSMEPRGRFDTGSVIVAVACSDGGKYVLELIDDRKLDYISTCGVFVNEALKRGREFRCFP